MKNKILSLVFAILLAFPALGEGLEGALGGNDTEQAFKKRRTDTLLEHTDMPSSEFITTPLEAAIAPQSVMMGDHKDLLTFLKSPEFHLMLTSVPVQKDLSHQESIEREEDMAAVERVCASLLCAFGRQDSSVGLHSAVDAAIIRLHNARKSSLSAAAPSFVLSPTQSQKPINYVNPEVREVIALQQFVPSHSPSPVAAGLSPAMQASLQPYNDGMYASAVAPGFMSSCPGSNPGSGYPSPYWQPPHPYADAQYLSHPTSPFSHWQPGQGYYTQPPYLQTGAPYYPSYVHGGSSPVTYDPRGLMSGSQVPSSKVQKPAKTRVRYHAVEK